MKAKAKKASSDSENIQSTYFVFDRSELLYLQWTLMCGALICRFVSYVVVECIPMTGPTWLMTLVAAVDPMRKGYFRRVGDPMKNGYFRQVTTRNET